MGATGDGDVAVIVGSSTGHVAQSREGVFGSGAAGCYPDATVEGLYTVEAGQTYTLTLNLTMPTRRVGAATGTILLRDGKRSLGQAMSIRLTAVKASPTPG